MSDTKAAFAALKPHVRRLRKASLRKMFESDPKRFQRFSISGAGLHLDYSKNLIDADAMAALLALAQSADVAGRRKAMFSGETINITEGRAVLHTALRANGTSKAKADGVPVDPLIRAELTRFLEFAEDVRQGRCAAADGKAFTDRHWRV
jgi:glucose-6-phosphate isomerase